MKPLIYLDNSTTTRPSEKAISRMLPFFQQQWGVPIAPHDKGQELYPAMEEAYRALYRLLGASEEDHLVITSSGAEAVNQVILSTYNEVTRTTGKNQFVTSTLDEAAQMMALAHLEELECVVKTLPVDSKGQLSQETLIEAVTPRTALVSLSLANGLTGTLHPVADLSEVCKERGILLHLDLSHALGKLYFDLEDLGADLITFSGDLFHAPKGTGVLWIKKGGKVAPLIRGGLEQLGLRAGHLNVPLLVALGVAAQEALEARDFLCTEVARLRDKLEREILDQIPFALRFFQDQPRLPHCTTLAFPGISNEALLFALNQRGVCASIGGGEFQQIARILKACGVAAECAETAISFSLSRETTEEEVLFTVKSIAEAAKRLKCLSEHLEV